MYIVLGVLYESYIHPITILSTLPSAGVGALLALMLVRQRPERHRDHRHHPADRHRQEERDHDDRLRARRRAAAKARRPREAIYQACLLRFRPIMMTTMAALLARAAADARHGRRLESATRSASPWWAACSFSQALTLFTTPGDLPGFRPPAPRAEAAPGGRARSRRRADRMNLSATVHPIARSPRRCSPPASRWRARSAFRLLPVSPLPQVDFPTISVQAALPGASPGDDGGDGGDAAGARARPHRRRHRDDLVDVARLDAHHAAVRPQPRHRRRGARRAGGDQRRAQRCCPPACRATRPTAR